MIKISISNHTAKELIRHIEMANNEGVHDEGVTKLRNRLKKIVVIDRCLV